MLKKKSAVLDVSLQQIREQLQAKTNPGRSSSSVGGSSKKGGTRSQSLLRRRSSSIANLTASTDSSTKND